VLLNWLIEVHVKLQLSPETMFVCTSLLDRFLSLKMVGRSKLQLVGCACMFIACKYQEIYATEVVNFVYLCEKSFSREEILRMEELILNVLNFNLIVPSSYGFAQRWLKVIQLHTNRDLYYMTRYFLELAILEYDMLQFLPSVVAASAAVLATEIMNLEFCESDLEKHSGHSISSLALCTHDLRELAKAAPFNKQCIVFSKYSHVKFHSVATTTRAYFDA
jgi:hypothetical protein